jgi:hypothetical protein
MANKTRKEGVQGHRLLKRRIVVVVLPPVEELDLVGPMQFLSAANFLSGKKVVRLRQAGATARTSRRKCDPYVGKPMLK